MEAQDRTALNLRAAQRPQPIANRQRALGNADVFGLASSCLEFVRVRLDIGQRNVPWTVLADPEGSEFCVLSPR